MEPIEQQLTELVAEQKTFIAKTNEELKNLGETKTETAEALTKIREKLDEAQKQIDAVDLKMSQGRFNLGGDPQEKNVGQIFTESEEFKAASKNDFFALRRHDGRARVPIDTLLSRKTNITTTSGITAATTGITVPQRIPGVVVKEQQALRIRDLMRVFPLTVGNAYDFVRQITRTNLASPQTEASTKAESTYAWDSQSKVVSTIAHFVNVTKQALQDVPWLQDMLNSELTYGLKLKEETELLSGDGLGSHISGLITQATAYSSGTYNVSGDTKLDKLRHGKLQARLAGLATFAPDAFVLNPTDMHAIELLKDEAGGANKGRYIIGDPKDGPTVKTVWGIPVVESDSITAGTWLVGAFGTAAYVVDRMDAMVEISFEHSSNFTANLATILAECRTGLAVTRPGAFITGSY